VLDPAHPITDFFDHDPERVLRSLPAIEQSSGKVSSLDTLYRQAGEIQLRGHRDGLFAAHIFGLDPDRFGHIATVGVVHPCVYSHLVAVLQIDTPDIAAIARGEKLLRGDKIIHDLLNSEDDDLTGPRGLAEAVRRRQSDHPLLPLLAITKIPVPPLAARPFHPSSEPEAVDPWIGSVNEAWLRVVEHAYRDSRINEIGAPRIILMNEAGMLQRALDDVYERTRRAEAWLVPAMERGSDEEIHAIAFAGPERIVIQRGSGIRIFDLSGREIHSAPPCGCILRGVVDGRFAVFHDFLRDIHPYNSEPGQWPQALVEHGMAQIFSPVSVLDVHTGSYLERAPANTPRTFVENDQPEELFLGKRKLHEIGGDRPAASAYTHDLRFALVSGDSTQIISLATGLTLVRPATTYPDEIQESLDLTTGKIVEHAWDDQGGGGGIAITFSDSRWFTFDHYGVLCDHIGNEAIVIVPRASAAAFDPAGRLLALAVDSELVIIDRVTRATVSRFPA
jgi:hypothetical protein